VPACSDGHAPGEPGADAVAVLGDSQYQKGELANFLAAYEPTWGRFRPHNASGVRQSRIRRRPPHDSAPGYYSYFGAAAGDPAKGYYRWDLPDWTPFALNSGALGYTRTRGDLPDDCSPVSRAAGSPHEAWLRAELAALPARHCVLDYWHHPRLSSGFGGAHQPQTPRLNRW
jgi:hypothetical protein